MPVLGLSFGFWLPAQDAPSRLPSQCWRFHVLFQRQSAGTSRGRRTAARHRVCSFARHRVFTVNWFGGYPDTRHPAQIRATDKRQQERAIDNPQRTRRIDEAATGAWSVGVQPRLLRQVLSCIIYKFEIVSPPLGGICFFSFRIVYLVEWKSPHSSVLSFVTWRLNIESAPPLRNARRSSAPVAPARPQAGRRRRASAAAPPSPCRG